MKSKPTIQKKLELTVFIRGEKIVFSSQTALLQSLVDDCANILKGLVFGRLKLFDAIKTGEGLVISPYEVYSKAYKILSDKRNKYRPGRQKINKAMYGTDRGYLFARLERDPIDRLEPRGKTIADRGTYAYEDSWIRKTQRNWKKFRKTQYK